MSGQCVHMGQFSVTIYAATGSVLSDNQQPMTRRDIFERFLTDGRIELESNIVERAIRPQTITRKNSLFAGSDCGGRT